MALNGLKRVDEFVPKPRPEVLFDRWNSTVKGKVALTMAMLNYLGVVEDEDAATEDLTEKYRTLKSTPDTKGRLYVAPSADVITIEEIWKASLSLGQIPSVDSFWRPGFEDSPDHFSTYSADVLDRAAPETEAAMMLPSDDEFHPWLHFTNQPFNATARPEVPDSDVLGSQTQLESLAAFKQEFEATHPGRVIKPIGNRAVIGMDMEDVIARRTGRQSLPGKSHYSTGIMRDAALPAFRHTGLYDSDDLKKIDVTGAVEITGGGFRLLAGSTDAVWNEGLGIGMQIEEES